MFIYGHNIPGYLPDDPPYAVHSFEEAKRGLIDDMLYVADAESYGPPEAEDRAEEITLAAEDVKLWSSPDSLYAGGLAWWIEYAEDDECSDEWCNTCHAVRYPRPEIPDVFGGVGLFGVMSDGGTLCERCMADESNPVHTDPNLDDGWRFEGWGTTDTVESFLACDHCNKILVGWEDEDEDEDEASCPQCGSPDHSSILACDLLTAERLIR